VAAVPGGGGGGQRAQLWPHACEGPQKHSITAETLREELLSKCNPELTEEMLEESLAALKKKTSV
jgi:hypothetical protein